MKVLPSAASASVPPLVVTSACWLHVPPLRVKTVVKAWEPKNPPPTTAVLPSADSVTGPAPPLLPTGKAIMFSGSQPLGPVEPRVSVHAESVPLHRMVLPSPDTATEPASLGD